MSEGVEEAPIRAPPPVQAIGRFVSGACGRVGYLTAGTDRRQADQETRDEQERARGRRDADPEVAPGEALNRSGFHAGCLV